MTPGSGDGPGGPATGRDAGSPADPVGPPAGATPTVGAADPPRPPATMLQQMGGLSGLLDSAVPVVVFVAVNSFAGLSWALWTAVGCGVLIAVLRLARRKPITQAIGGLVAVGVAALIAARTGSAKDFFLLGIWTQLLYGAAFLVSMVVRWPLVGLAWEGVNGRGTAWRRDRRLRRRYTWATAVWVVVFLARFLVQRWLYDQDAVGWLAAVRIVMGYPVFLVGLLVSALIVFGPEVWHRPGATMRERVAGVREGLRGGTPGSGTRAPDA